MRRVLAPALGVLLGGLMLFGSAADLGAVRGPVATALLLGACGAGALLRRGTCPASRRRDALLLVPAILLRGPLCDLLMAVLPAGASPAALAVELLTLVPAGLLLGRLLRGALDGSFAALLLGLALGVLAGGAGVPGLLHPLVMVPLAVALLWWLARPAPGTGSPATAAAEAPVARPGAASSGLLLGAAFALVGLCFRRVVPAYATPTAHPGMDVLLVLVLPAAVVAWPAGLLARGRGAPWLGALGGLLLCAAALVTTNSLGLYENSVALVELKRMFHDRALQAGGLVADWHVWLLSFAGAVAAALGMASGALRGTRSAAGALLGAGVAHMAEHAFVAPHGPHAGIDLQAPLRLLLAASSCGLLFASLCLFGRKGWLALPLAALPFLDWQPAQGAPWFSTGQLRRVAGFDEVRRPGEYSAECFQRSPLVDVTTFSTPGPDSRAVEGREAFTQTLSRRNPVFSLGPDGKLQTVLGQRHAHATFADGEAEPESPEGGEPREEHAEDEALERFYGVRVAGRALHAQHVPTGAEGSVGRLTRLFAVPGRMLVCGVGAELVAADLHDAGLAASLRVASDAPLGHDAVRLLLDHLDSSGWQAARVGETQADLRSAASASVDTLVVAPGPESVPGTTELSTLQSVERMRRALAPGGRCLVWLDTAELGARELRARVAAFGAAFGERSAAFVEPRELDAPFVLLLGWVDDAGRPARAALQAQLPWPDATGLRTRLRTVEDLGALLLRDGPGLARLADEGPVHARARPICSVAGSESGWAAVQQLVDESRRLESVVSGAGGGTAGSREVYAGLAMHSRYAYRLLGLNDTLLEIKPDVEWSSFDAEVAAYARAAEQAPDDPLLHLALAALLEPLAIVGDLTRFATAWEACRAERLESWRLALQEAWVRKEGLQGEESEAAVERARRWAAGG